MASVTVPLACVHSGRLEPITFAQTVCWGCVLQGRGGSWIRAHRSTQGAPARPGGAHATAAHRHPARARVDAGPGVNRDDAIRVGVMALAAWHRQDHGDRCVCEEGEQFGAQAAAVVDALIAEGVPL